MFCDSAPVVQGAASLAHLTGATSWQVIPYTDGTLSSDMRNRPTINGKPKGPRRPVVQLSGADANGRAIYAEITKTDNGGGMSVRLPPGSAFSGFIDCTTLFTLIPTVGSKVHDYVPALQLQKVVNKTAANFNL
nr:hypothetical protein [Pandoravirus aubagnensis]